MVLNDTITLQLTGGKIGDHLMAEAETNLAINVLPGALSDSYEVQGRGELQLGLILGSLAAFKPYIPYLSNIWNKKTFCLFSLMNLILLNL